MQAEQPINSVDETLLSMLRDLCLPNDASDSLLDIIELLVQHRDAMSNYYDIVLRRSARKGHLHIARLLVDNGCADIHDHDDYALRHAARKGHLHIVRYLLDVGADLHAEDDYALRISATNRHVDIVRLLIEHGADVHVVLNDAIRKSACNGHLDVAKILLQHGANAYTRSAEVIRNIIASGNLDMVMCLVAHVGSAREQCDQALILSAENGQRHIVDYFMYQVDCGRIRESKSKCSLIGHTTFACIFKKELGRRQTIQRELAQAMQAIHKNVQHDDYAPIHTEIVDAVDEEMMSTLRDESTIATRRSSRARRPSARHRMSTAVVRLPFVFTSGVKKSRIHKMANKRTSVPVM